jgi:hypothetical protein
MIPLNPHCNTAMHGTSNSIIECRRESSGESMLFCFLLISRRAEAQYSRGNGKPRWRNMTSRLPARCLSTGSKVTAPDLAHISPNSNRFPKFLSTRNPPSPRCPPFPPLTQGIGLLFFNIRFYGKEEVLRRFQIAFFLWKRIPISQQ